MTNEKINSTVEEIMEYEALLDEVKGIVDGLKDNPLLHFLLHIMSFSLFCSNAAGELPAASTLSFYLRRYFSRAFFVFCRFHW